MFAAKTVRKPMAPVELLGWGEKFCVSLLFMTSKRESRKVQSSLDFVPAEVRVVLRTDSGHPTKSQSNVLRKLDGGPQSQRERPGS